MGKLVSIQSSEKFKRRQTRRVVISNSAEETYALGVEIGETAQPGMVISLVGDLGAGKTVFTQGVAKGLGVKGIVNSPTFTILQVHEDGRLPLYHFDVYRIMEPEELYEIGMEEYFYGEGVTIVEWADLIKEMLPLNYLHVLIEKDLVQGGDYRRIVMNVVGVPPEVQGMQ
ncbi:MAG: tRNA (adenosine(37)-N6)-threonylcarbamoyltransferase complex ATPase subunit type 1 TsaE [Lachnospiraceae bacterium]|nr:tRNA (adenosine(37)-N6)-threonylcarbamoyltransferase complex ATPase subunit type 1 TsaE [Lachnospiraceae bacterium]